MKTILWLAALLASITVSAAEDDCRTKYQGKIIEGVTFVDYKGDVDKTVAITVNDWSEAAKKTGNQFDRRITIQPVKTIDGMSFYGGAINYGDKTEFHTALNFQSESGEQVAWFLSSPEFARKVAIVLWYSNEKCHLKVVVPLKGNKAIKLAPATPTADAKRKP